MTKINLGFNFDNSYKDLSKVFYTKTEPANVPSPELVIFNQELADELALNYHAYSDDDIARLLSGKLIADGAYPIAQAYAGHQFGYFTMLGDGRAILLGEHIGPDNRRYDIQFKGSGRTKYSRGGDGKASLGPMLREYIVSEAMYHLNIPSTRSLAVVETGERVIRERPLKGAILTRIASSHIRVGTFQYIAAYGKEDELKELADYTINRHFKSPDMGENPYVYLLEEVIKKQASLISKWQLVGFIHGVMNTDNMAINGETIDYGPCAFMEVYDPDTVFSSIDHYGRYAYNKQSEIALWNLSRFSETLLPLIDNDLNKAVEIAKRKLMEFPKLYRQNWLDGMRKKLGLIEEDENDIDLIDDLLNLMKKYKADYTNTFLALTFDKKYDLDLIDSDEFKNWHQRWKTRLAKEKTTEEDILNLMKANNPSVIPRNHLVEQALNKAIDGDYTLFKDLLNVLSNPYDHNKKQEKYQKISHDEDRPFVTYCGT